MAALRRFCVECGSACSVEQKFCGNCGVLLPPPPPACPPPTDKAVVAPKPPGALLAKSKTAPKPPGAPPAAKSKTLPNPEPAARNPFGTRTGKGEGKGGEPAARNPFGTPAGSDDTAWLEVLHQKNQEDKESWTDAHCSYCDYVESYKRMRSEKVWLSYSDCLYDKKEDEFLWLRECWKCLGQRIGLATEAESRKYILTHSRDYTQKKAKVDAFNTAKRLRKAFFPMLKARGAYQAQRTMVTREDMVSVFTPLVEFILIKAQQIEKEDEELTEVQRLLHQMSELADPSMVSELVDQIVALSREGPCLAFRNRTDGGRSWFATTYADEWSGCLGGWFRSYFVCMGPCGWKDVPNESSGKSEYHPIALPETCCTLMPSKAWKTKYPDALASGQCWYCWCMRRYAASWGVVIEMMTLSGELIYARADCPPTDVLDIRAMKIESEMPDATAEEIYNKMPIIPPQHSELVAPHPTAPSGEGYFYIQPKDYNSLPHFNWRDVYTLTGAPVEIKKTKKEEKAERWAEWEVSQSKSASSSSK